MIRTEYTVDFDAHHDGSNSVSLLSEGEGNLWAQNLTTPVVCGRTHENLQLLKAYEQVIRSNSSAVAVVHGVSGVGKTTLVENLRETVCDSRGYFCNGKFFQNTGVKEPYSAIMTALSDLCDLVSQSPDFDDNRRNEIRKALGPDCSVLSRVITNLSGVTGDLEIEEDDVDPKNDVAYTKFKVAVMHFLHAMTSPKHPIVMFIDDLQWMDEGSMHLITMLLQDTVLINTLLIFSYRDEDADKVEFMFRPSELKSRVIDLPVECLDRTAVYHLLSASLGSNSSEVHALSDVVWHKTVGNPFHVLRLMEHVKEEGLMSIQHKANSSSWSFNTDEIRERIQVSDSVAGLLALKAARLDPTVQETCKVASLLGFSFNERVLHGLCSTPGFVGTRTGECGVADDSASGTSISETVCRSLAASVEEGLLERTKEGYRFGHDKILSCFQSMMTESEQARLHRLIGEWFLNHGDPESVYAAANHLNQGIGLVESTQEKIKMAKLNLAASKYSREKSAFVDAAGFLRRANEMLDPDTKWVDHHDLAFEVAESLSKVELIIGNFDASTIILEDAFEHCKFLDEKVVLLLIEVEARMAASDIDSTIAAVNRTLNILGVNVPSKISTRHVMFKLFKVTQVMRHKTNRDILSMPAVRDVLQKAAVRLLFYGSCYCGQKSATKELTFYTLLAVELSLLHGLAPCSPPALAMYATLHVAMGNHAQAYRIGNLALAILEQVKCKEVSSATIVLCMGLASHWREPIEMLGPSFDRAVEDGFDVGDVVYAIFSCSNSVSQRCFIGENLETVEAFQRPAYQRSCEFGHPSLLHWVSPIIQFVLNLRMHPSSWRDVLALNGEMINETEYLEFAREANNTSYLWIFWLHKLQLAYHFGFLEEAASAVKEVAAVADTSSRSHFNVYQWYFLASSVGYELHRSTGEYCQLKSARKYHKAMEKLKLSPNCEPFLSFLNAHNLASKRRSRPDDVTGAYIRAISVMAERKWPHMEGLANERLAFYLTGVGKFDQAIPYFNRAIRLYHDKWGSVAKYEWLKEASVRAMPGRYKRRVNPELYGVRDVLDDVTAQ
jgi:predicted ATPase